jgi:hypothetical protein
MASRCLTEVFILMRNKAMQSRHIYSEQVSIPYVYPDTIYIYTLGTYLLTYLRS